MSPPKKTQWVVVIPMSPQSGKLPLERWMCFGDQNISYTIEPSEFAKFTSYSRGKLKEFTGRIMSDHNHLTKVAKDIQKLKLEVGVYRATWAGSSQQTPLLAHTTITSELVFLRPFLFPCPPNNERHAVFQNSRHELGLLIYLLSVLFFSFC
ncbi:hypothetical protein DFS33DRAFT_504604 [Desarmillaria ectypa]|nr:hypothetical protein DFS33DRAFT_504604 [Desarmillaria ectypa]